MPARYEYNSSIVSVLDTMSQPCIMGDMSLVVTLTLERMSLGYLGNYVLGRDLDLDTYVLGIPWDICVKLKTKDISPMV
jgi:hypothetical protein